MTASDPSQDSRRILFSRELADGRIRLSQLARAEVRDVTTTRVVPSRVSRAYQARLMRRGRLGYEQHTVVPMLAARRAVLGDDAAGPPRLLVRIDAPLDHPVHGRLATAGLPTLVAAPGRRLTDAELNGVAELRRAGGTIALETPELRDIQALDEAIGDGLQALSAHQLAPDIAVARAPRWQQWPVLARHFAVVCGDPRSVRTFGFHDTPQSRGKGIWMPAWPPFAGRATDALAAAKRLAGQGAALWAPVLLDGDDPDLERFVAEAGRWTAGWDDFLATVQSSAT